MKNGIAKKIPAIVLGALLITLMLSVNALAADEGTWMTRASMSKARMNFQTEVVNGKIYAIGGMSSGPIYLSSTEVYDPASNTWTSLAPMSIARYGFRTECIDGKIYAIGGMSGGSAYLSSVEVYDPALNTWTSLAPMSTERYYLETTVINGKIYALGGKNSSGYLSSAEVYDPKTNAWTTLTPMSTARFGFGVDAVDGKIYTIGGSYDGNNSLASAEVYDPSTNTWTTLAPMSTARLYLKTEVINGKIYAISGSTNTAEKYDLKTNTWTPLAPMSLTRIQFQTNVFNGKLYVIGGNWSEYYSSLEAYNPKADTWTALAPMSSARIIFRSEIVNGKIYAIGGSNGSTSLSSVEAYTIPLEPTAPTLSATAGDKQVNLSWTSIDGAVSYNIYRSTTSGGPYTSIASNLTGTTYTDSGLTNGTTYYYVVTAMDSSGTESPYSNEASATPASATPVYDNATLRITMLTGEVKEYNVTAAVAQDFVAWVNSKAASSPVYAFPKTFDLGPYHARTEYVAYSNISSFEILMY